MSGPICRPALLLGGGALLAALMLGVALRMPVRPQDAPRPNVTTQPWSEARKAGIRTACMRRWAGRGQAGWLNQCLNQVPRDFAW